MKSATALGILLSTAIFACAPVASSVPKMATVSPRTGDAITDSSAALPIHSSAKVVANDALANERKTLENEGYQTDVYDLNSHAVSDHRELRQANDIRLVQDLNWAEVVVLFVMKSDAKPIAPPIDSDLHVFTSRVKKNEFSLGISPDGDSDAAWSYVKKNLDSIVIATREAKATN